MSAPGDDRLASLERRVARLEQLVARLSQVLAVRSDNPEDRRAVRDKEEYDWQRRE